MSAYRPDYLFLAVIGFWGGYPYKSRLSKDLQDKPLIKALGNGPMRWVEFVRRFRLLYWIVLCSSIWDLVVNEAR